MTALGRLRCGIGNPAEGRLWAVQIRSDFLHTLNAAVAALVSLGSLQTFAAPCTNDCYALA